MIQAKPYAPTFEHHQEALDVVKASRVRRAVTGTVLSIVLILGIAWWRSGFTFPFTPDWIDISIGILGAAVTQMSSYFDRKNRAKSNLELQELDTKEMGQRYYRADRNGLEWWWFNAHDRIEWSHFDSYKVTDELLVVARARSGHYWALPRADLGPDLLAALIDILRQGGAKEVAQRPVASVVGQPT
jgi:hypothetical protein